MNKLWAPWRTKYISNVTKKPKGCIFCTKPKQKKDKENLIIFRSKHCCVLMNLYPYNNGHLLIAPYKHTANISNLSVEERLDIFNMIDLSVEKLKQTLKPDGFNIGANLGRIAGAGIADHIHFHIVPRWGGDTNFMPVLSDTKVISQSLEDCRNILVDAFGNK